MLAAWWARTSEVFDVAPHAAAGAAAQASGGINGTRALRAAARRRATAGATASDASALLQRFNFEPASLSSVETNEVELTQSAGGDAGGGVGGDAAHGRETGRDAKARAPSASAASASRAACATHVQRRRKNDIFISPTAHADVLAAGREGSAPPRVSVFASDLTIELPQRARGGDGATSSSGAPSRGGGDEHAPAAARVNAAHVSDRRSSAAENGDAAAAEGGGRRRRQALQLALALLPRSHAARHL